VSSWSALSPPWVEEEGKEDEEMCVNLVVCFDEADEKNDETADEEDFGLKTPGWSWLEMEDEEWPGKECWQASPVAADAGTPFERIAEGVVTPAAALGVGHAAPAAVDTEPPIRKIFKRGETWLKIETREGSDKRRCLLSRSLHKHNIPAGRIYTAQFTH
jgi:hypothetical protein